MSDLVHGILFGTPKLYIAPYGEAELDLVDKVFAVHAGNRGFDSHRRHKSERYFRSSTPGYPHPVSCELEKWYQSGGRWMQCH